MNNNIEEIVFENRNKEYGAYKLRKQKNKYLLLSIIISFSIILLFVIFIHLKSVYDAFNKTETYKDLTIYETINLENIEQLDKKELLLPPKTIKKDLEIELEEKIETFIIADSTEIYNDSLKLKDTEIESNLTLAKDSLLNILDDTKKTEKIIYYNIVDMPFYFEGIKELRKYIANNIKFPQDANDKKITGTVIIQFCVKKTGEIDSIKINQSVYPSIDAEAVRVIKLVPQWILAQNEHENVKIWYIVPIKFANF